MKNFDHRSINDESTSKFIFTTFLTTSALVILMSCSLLPRYTALGNQTQVQKLFEQFKDGCWVAYSPTTFDPTTKPIKWPTKAEIVEDLRVLHIAGFNGLVTYGNFKDPTNPNQLIDISHLAQESGFNFMIIGIWDPNDENELAFIEKVSKNPILSGISVGNEGLGIRYNLSELSSAIKRLKKTGLPVTTTEEAHDYVGNSPLYEISDWIFPNVHPYYASIYNPQRAVEYTRRIFSSLSSATEKYVVLKEVGLPSADGSPNLSEKEQAIYYRQLSKTNVDYVIFEAYDAPWKHNLVNGKDPEPHWGLFTVQRKPKEAVSGICSQQ